MHKILKQLPTVLCTLILCSFTLVNLGATCSISAPNDNGDHFPAYSGYVTVTQHFVACESGPLNTFAFKAFSHYYKAENGTVSIEDLGTGSTVSFGGNLVNIGTVDIIPTTNGTEETFTFTPSVNFQLTAGNTYKVVMDLNIVPNNPTLTGGQARSGGIEFSRSTLGDSNVGIGSVVSNNSGLQGNSEGRMMTSLVFNANMGNPIDPIPTISQWGLMIFGLLILNLGVFAIYRQERAFL